MYLCESVVHLLWGCSAYIVVVYSRASFIVKLEEL